MRTSDAEFKSRQVKKTRACAAGHEGKQRWKQLPGNRYTPKELRAMAQKKELLRIEHPEFHLMHLD